METVTRTFGAAIEDLDASDVGPEEARRIKETLYRHRLVILKGQRLSPEAYVAFARRLGEPIVYLQEHYRHPDHPEIFVSSNEHAPKGAGKDAKIGVARAGDYWHADGAFLPKPYPLTMLYPQRLPEMQERSTLFIDMHEVYEALPGALREQVEGRWIVNDGKWRYKVRAQDAGFSISEILEAIGRVAPPVRHPAVTVHPATRERALYVNRGFTTAVEGLSHEASAALLDRLFAFAEQERFVREHVWGAGDVALWDNRSVLHRAGEVLRDGQYSTMYRITVDDHLPLHATPAEPPTSAE